jgi:hypothetical protein
MSEEDIHLIKVTETASTQYTIGRSANKKLTLEDTPEIIDSPNPRNADELHCTHNDCTQSFDNISEARAHLNKVNADTTPFSDKFTQLNAYRISEAIKEIQSEIADSDVHSTELLTGIDGVTAEIEYYKMNTGEEEGTRVYDVEIATRIEIHGGEYDTFRPPADVTKYTTEQIQTLAEELDRVVSLICSWPGDPTTYTLDPDCESRIIFLKSGQTIIKQ